MTEPALQVDELGVQIDAVSILDGVTFELARASSLSVIGPNGAGKSTLLKSLIRILPITSGAIRVDGRLLQDYSQRELCRLLAYVPQAQDRSVPYTVRQFVELGRYPHVGRFSAMTSTDHGRVDACLRQTATETFADRPLDSLSGGERQKVFIASALAQDARILLVDEPTTFLDYRHCVDVLHLLADLRGRDGWTTVSVTHDLNEAVFGSDLVLALKDGRVAFLGPPGDLIGTGRLEQIYETGFVYLEHPETGAPVVLPRGENHD